MKRLLSTLRRGIADERWWVATYVVTAGIAIGVCLARQCNNFLIFRSAFRHVVSGIDLYVPHPGEHADLFKYSPTFALLFAPFAVRDAPAPRSLRLHRPELAGTTRGYRIATAAAGARTLVGRWSDADHRRSFLASLLVYSVIFNHKAEHPSYVIAVVGIAIWYAVGARTAAKSVLTGLVLASTVPVFVWVAMPQLLGSELVPLELTAAACALAWMGMQVELLDLVPAADGTLATPEMQPAE